MSSRPLRQSMACPRLLDNEIIEIISPDTSLPTARDVIFTHLQAPCLYLKTLALSQPIALSVGRYTVLYHDFVEHSRFVLLWM